MTAFGFEHKPLFRFTAAMNALELSTLNDLRIDILKPRDLALARNRYVGVKIKTFATMFSAVELARLIKTARKVELSPTLENFVDILEGAMNDAKSDEIGASYKDRMI